MPQPKSGQFLIDGISSLDAGVNSGLSPTLLPPNQLAMSTNMTFRGGYGTHRPVIREISLDFKWDSVLEDACIHHAFQGACFYQPDTGAQSLVAAIGGKLFQFFPSGTTAPVLDVSIPGDPNPSNPQQAWLWQCERFVVWNDGVSLPVFFDGSTSRRSSGANKVLATISIAAITPAVGSNVDVTVTVPYTGPTNIPVLINGKQFTLLSTGSSTSPSATITPYHDPATSHALGEAIISYPNRIGTLLQTIPAGTVTPVVVTTSNLVDSNNRPVATGTLVSIGNEQFIYTHGVQQPGGNIQASLTLVRFISSSNSTSTAHASGSIITIQSSAPSVTIGLVAANFSVAPLVDIAVNPIFTGSSQVVWIGSGQYFIIPKTPVVTNVVTLQNVGGTPGDPMTGDIIALPELPPGRMGAYGMGRNWMALTDGTSFIASDIVGGTSGTEIYSFRDAPLRVTENSYLAGGGAFRVPGALGDIRAMKFSPTLDVSLGQGPLQVFTTRAAFSCDAPVDRTTWSNVTNPILTQALLGAGALSQNGTTTANGDIIFRAIDGLRSLILARRDFDTWGNVPQSREVETILAQDNATLVQFESLVEFDNRLLLSILPTNGPLGVFHQGIIALNEDPISTLRGKAPSIYDGLWTGMNVLQLVEGVFNGVSRCYVFCFDSVLSRIRIFEIQKTDAAAFDNDTTPVTYSFESASLFNNPKIKGQFELAELQDGEIYISDLRGVADFEVWWKNSFSDCWKKWINFGVCGNNTNTSKPLQFRAPLGLGSPPVEVCDPNTKMPARIGLNFQVRIQVTGSCKFRGAKFKATLVPETRFSVPQCKPLCDAVLDATVDCEPCVDIIDCLKFPLVLYNLNANKTYQNDLQSVQVTCPDGTVQTVVVPAGTITYTLPFSPGFTGDYPPLVMNCLSGGVIVKTVPSGATQDEIDLIVGEMITQCVQAYAQSIANCGSKLFSSEQVSTVHTCPGGETLNFTGTLPSWITIDGSTGTVTAKSGIQSSPVSVAAATDLAQTQLNSWVQSKLTSGNLACQSASMLTLLPEPSSDTGATLPTLSDPPVGAAEVGAVFYLLTKSGLTFTSLDGLTWTDLSSNANTLGLTYTGMVYGGGVFVAFSSSTGQFAASNDGITWTSVAPSGGQGGGMGKLQVGLYFSGQLTIFDEDGDAFTSSNWFSSDGTLYQANSAGNLNNVRVVAQNDNTVAVAAGISGFIFFSADGTTWPEANDGAFFSDWKGVAFGNGIFVVVGSNPRVITSVDGNNWTTQTTVINEDLVSIAFGNGVFVAISKTKAWSSSDGINWSVLTYVGAAALNKAFYLSVLTFLGYEEAATVVLIPQESSGWGATETVFGWVQLAGVMYGLSDNNIYTSTDGVNFGSIGVHGIAGPTSMTYGNGLFVVGTSSTFLNRAWTSPDGITWTLHAAGQAPIFVAFGNGIFVGIGDGFKATVSLDGSTWVSQSVMTAANPRGIAFGAGVFIAASAGGLASSSDGVTWVDQHFGNYRGVAFVDNQFVAVGSGGIIATSPDGIVWTDQTSGTGNDLASVGGGGGTLIAMSAFGTTNAYQSTDGGVTWAFLKHETNDDFPSAIGYYSVTDVIDAGFFV